MIKSALSEELIAMSAADQALRRKWPEGNDPEWVARIKTLDQKHTARLKQIIQEQGWPTISKVGAEASTAAWLLVQHADDDLDFQMKCLDLMKAGASQVDPKNIAYLTDRVLVAQGKPQMYGTQFYRREGKGKHIPRPIKSPEMVDSLRAEIGLDSLEEYAKHFN